jgi:hypothetical protein
MVARVATFENINLDLVDEVSAWNQTEVLPRARALAGYRAGLSIINRDERTVRGIVLFDSEEQARAAESTFAELPKLMPEDLRQRVEASGRRGPTVEVCDVLMIEGLGRGDESG